MRVSFPETTGKIYFLVIFPSKTAVCGCQHTWTDALHIEFSIYFILLNYFGLFFQHYIYDINCWSQIIGCQVKRRRLFTQSFLKYQGMEALLGLHNVLFGQVVSHMIMSIWADLTSLLFLKLTLEDIFKYLKTLTYARHLFFWNAENVY